MNQSNTTSSATRWLMLSAGVLLQICLGSLYLWSLFTDGFVKTAVMNKAAFGLASGLSLAIMTIGATLGGRIQDKIGPRMVVLIGGALFSLGFLLTSLVPQSSGWLIFVTYSGMAGFGMGMVYTTTIATIQKWFPDKRGLVTGLLVAALGASGLILTDFVKNLVASYTDTYGAFGGNMHAFADLSGVFACVVGVTIFFIKAPPEGYTPKGWSADNQKSKNTLAVDYSPAQVVKTKQYYLLFLAYMFACSAGFMVIPFAKPLAATAGLKNIDPATAVIVISVFNAVGRLFWGWLSDRLTRRIAMLIAMVVAAATIPLVAYVTGNLFLVLMALVGFTYGGFLGMFPSMTSDFYGLKNQGMNYGLVLLGFGAGALVFTFLKGALADAKALPIVSFAISAGVIVLGAIIMIFLKKPEKKS